MLITVDFANIAQFPMMTTCYIQIIINGYVDVGPLKIVSHCLVHEETRYAESQDVCCYIRTYIWKRKFL